MKFFADTVTKPYINMAGYRSVCEIGASTGDNTDKILETKVSRYVIIDPCLDRDLVKKYENDARVEVRVGTSLDMLPQVSEQFDCILIDGDHNWYTVFNELRLIKQHDLLRDGGAIFFHDVGWPYGRRDMYYRPEFVPAEFRKEFAKKAIVKGRSELAENESEGVNAILDNALHEGGPRNGVLSAIEDFLKTVGPEYRYFSFPEENGFGVLTRGGGLLGGAVRARFLVKAWLRSVRFQSKAVARRIIRGDKS